MLGPRVLSFIATCCAIASCAKSSSTAAPPASAEPSPAQPTPPTAAPPPPTVANLVVCGESVPPIGVPECDAYAIEYSHCILTRVPAEHQEASCEVLSKSLDHWRGEAGSPERRQALADGCSYARRAVADACGAPTETANVDPEAPALTIGVPECDAYLATYMRCVEMMPEPDGAVALEALERTVDAWRKAAQTESGRDAVAKACATAARTNASAAACE